MMRENATLEVDGKVYALASATIEQTMGTRTTRRGEVWKVREGLPWAAVTTHDMTARLLHDKGPMRCRVNFGGAVYEGMSWVMAWSDSDSEVTIRVEELEPVAFLAAPTLDETTNPADVEWGEVRSAVAAKDWRRAWEVVGTDHTGEATPGEAYIFGNARRVSCTTAALMAWRGVALPIQTMMLRHVEVASDVETHAVRKMVARKFSTVEAWQRIKAIAAWESSAAAQYVKRAPARYNFRSMEVRVGGQVIGGYDVSPTGDHTAVYFDEMSTFTREDYDRLLARQQAQDEFRAEYQSQFVEPEQPTGLFRNPFVPANLARVMTHGGGETYTLTINGERQTYTVPASAIPDIAGALRDYIGQPLTAATRAAVESTVRRVTQDTARVASGNAAISPNPAPHGPNPRRRR